MLIPNDAYFKILLLTKETKEVKVKNSKKPKSTFWIFVNLGHI